jgi:hypothetical protein
VCARQTLIEGSMATLRSVLETANGLYRESRTGQGYQRQDLLDQLPEEALNSPVHIRKVSPGVYQIELERNGNGTYDLFSRRREVRGESPTK